MSRPAPGTPEPPAYAYQGWARPDEEQASAELAVPDATPDVQSELDEIAERQGEFIGWIEDARSMLDDAAEWLGGAIEEADSTAYRVSERPTDRAKEEHAEALDALHGAAKAAYESLTARLDPHLARIVEQMSDGALLDGDKLSEHDDALVEADRAQISAMKRGEDLVHALRALRELAGPEALGGVRPYLSAEGAEAARLLMLGAVAPRSASAPPDTAPPGANPAGSPGALRDQVDVQTAPGRAAESGGNVDERQEQPSAGAVEVEQGAVDALPAEAPALERFSQTPRDYQRAAIDDALAFTERALALDPDAPAERRRIAYGSPTGSGKGSMQLALLQETRARGLDAWIFTPSLEVLRGYLERCGATPEMLEQSAEKLAELGEGIFVTTPTRARNRIMQGARGVPEVVIYDEVHHAIEENDVSGTLFAVAPLAVWIGWTATLFRGTPQGTQALEATWPEQVEVLTIPEAVKAGAWALPTFEVVALVDDDKIKVTAGKFNSKGTTKVFGPRIDALAELVRDRINTANVPTAIAVPSREVGGLLVEALDRIGVNGTLISAQTKPRDRARAYAEARDCRTVLVSVRVISEGVDMPWLRRLIDARPTLSPVAWLQFLGRVTRPGEIRPEYVCVCRNLERHAYLLSGLVPRSVVAKSQEDFGAPSKRTSHRSIGLEQLSRFKQIPIPLDGGVKGAMNLLYCVDKETGTTTEWATLLDPTSERYVCARRTVNPPPPGVDRDGNPLKRTRADYGKWELAQLPAELTGFATSKGTHPASKAQREWWRKAARRYGLDPDAKLSARAFQALPILSDCRVNMYAQGAGE